MRSWVAKISLHEDQDNYFTKFEWYKTSDSKNSEQCDEEASEDKRSRVAKTSLHEG